MLVGSASTRTSASASKWASQRAHVATCAPVRWSGVASARCPQPGHGIIRRLLSPASTASSIDRSYRRAGILRAGSSDCRCDATPPPRPRLDRLHRCPGARRRRPQRRPRGRRAQRRAVVGAARRAGAPPAASGASRSPTRRPLPRRPPRGTAARSSAGPRGSSRSSSNPVPTSSSTRWSGPPGWGRRSRRSVRGSTSRSPTRSRSSSAASSSCSSPRRPARACCRSTPSIRRCTS